MKRFISITAVAAGLAMLCAITASSAAAQCLLVQKMGAGNFAVRCGAATKAENQDWVKPEPFNPGTGNWHHVNGDLWCVKIASANQPMITKSFANATKCEKNEEEGGGKLWVQVWLPRIMPPAPQIFRLAGGSSTLTAGGNTVSCTSGAGTGEVTGESSEGGLVVDFSGCKSSGSGGLGCTIKSNNTVIAGLIIAGTLKGELGYSEQATSEAALVLKPSSGKVITELAGNSCTPTTKVTGSLVGELTPTDVSATTGKLILALSSGKQAITEVLLSSGSFVEPELVAFTATATTTSSDAVTYTSAIEIT